MDDLMMDDDTDGGRRFEKNLAEVAEDNTTVISKSRNTRKNYQIKMTLRQNTISCSFAKREWRGMSNHMDPIKSWRKDHRDYQTIWLYW